jgi:hypothetical protein
MDFGHHSGAGEGHLILMEGAASLCDGGVEIVDRIEMFVDERLVDKWP